MFVKVCGITNWEDAQAAIEGGARALGFNFYPGSPRFIEPASLLSWIHKIPSDVWRVGVFVNRPADDVERVYERLTLDVAQLHGSEEASDVPHGIRVWKAFRVGTALNPSINEFPAEAVLLDGLASGRTFAWSIARKVTRPLIVAGGLHEGNVLAAIEETQPWGVDVCSSIEISPGKKDQARMARFLKACQPQLSTLS